jgi:hypothetical protein
MGDTNVGRRHSAKMSSRFGETISGFLGVAAICRRNAVNRNNQDTKNEKPTVFYGTGKAAPKSSTILGPLRRKWLYVGRIIGNEVSENDVKDYLQNIDCHDEIIIKKLTTKGHNSAFSIGVPPKYSTMFSTLIFGQIQYVFVNSMCAFFREETPYPKQHVSSTDETKVFNVPIQNITSIINILHTGCRIGLRDMDFTCKSKEFQLLAPLIILRQNS